MQHKETLPSIREGLTKKQLAQLASESVDNVLEEGNVFEVAEAIAAMEEFVKTVRKDERYVQFLRDELAKHRGMMVTKSGAKIEMCEAGVSYDYSGNSEWNILEQQISILKQQQKMVEEKLRRIGEGRTVVDFETGEVVEGAGRKSRSTYKITLRKY